MACSARVVVEAQLVEPERGLAPKGDGWFVLNAREAQWWKRRVTVCDFEGEPRFRQLGINLTLLEPGEPMTMYHWEADQEDFLILSGEAEGKRGARTPWTRRPCATAQESNARRPREARRTRDCRRGR